MRAVALFWRMLLKSYKRAPLNPTCPRLFALALQLRRAFQARIDHDLSRIRFPFSDDALPSPALRESARPLKFREIAASKTAGLDA
jgi:hypothetical protein